MTDAAIRLTDVTKRFGGTTAVDDLSLAVPTGSIYGFIGPNGSGKTTTLRMIMHILLPDEGQHRGARLAPTPPRPATASAICPKSAGSTRR